MKLFYPKFAWDTIRKNRRSYIPYMLTTLFVVAIFHILRNITWMPYLIHQRGASEIAMTACPGQLCHRNFLRDFSVLHQQLPHEAAEKRVWPLLTFWAWSKRHIARILFYETLILRGDRHRPRVMPWGPFWIKPCRYLLLMHLIGRRRRHRIFLSYRNAFTDTLGTFRASFFWRILSQQSLRQIHFTSAIEPAAEATAQGSGSQRPNGSMTLSGRCFPGLRDILLAITIKQPHRCADRTVLRGSDPGDSSAPTSLFTAGSIVFLKLLRKNKKYYYQTRHFICRLRYALSDEAERREPGQHLHSLHHGIGYGLLHHEPVCRQSENRRVPVPPTASIFLSGGMTPPMTASGWQWTPCRKSAIRSTAHRYSRKHSDISPSEAFSRAIHLTRDNVGEDSPTLDEFTNAASVSWISLSDYNRLSGANAALNSGEALMYTAETYTHSTMTVGNTPVTIAKSIPAFPLSSQLTISAYPCYVLVVPDQDFSSLSGDGSSLTITYVGFDLRDSALEETFSHQWSSFIEDQFGKTDSPFTYSIATRSIMEEGLLSSYAGLFFLGIFLGLTFLVATILIIYYKQVSEGLQDARRYDIMRQVGLTGTGDSLQHPLSGADRILPAPHHCLYSYHVCVSHGEGLSCRPGDDQYPAVPDLCCHLLRRVRAGVSGGLFPDLQGILSHCQSEAVKIAPWPNRSRRKTLFFFTLQAPF